MAKNDCSVRGAMTIEALIAELDAVIASIQRTRDSSATLRRYRRVRDKIVAALTRAGAQTP